mmetsp:Transcript_62705/g.152659  ORF Transcript_62705/g.152659 Transcript_62705/m.152659 type:complete len:268 (+) Transcript_62705:1534-2337(+)
MIRGRSFGSSGSSSFFFFFPAVAAFFLLGFFADDDDAAAAAGCDGFAFSFAADAFVFDDFVAAVLVFFWILRACCDGLRRTTVRDPCSSSSDSESSSSYSSSSSSSIVVFFAFAFFDFGLGEECAMGGRLRFKLMIGSSSLSICIAFPSDSDPSSSPSSSWPSRLSSSSVEPDPLSVVSRRKNLDVFDLLLLVVPLRLVPRRALLPPLLGTADEGDGVTLTLASAEETAGVALRAAAAAVAVLLLLRRPCWSIVVGMGVLVDGTCVV